MKLKQLENLVAIDQNITNYDFSNSKITISRLLKYGFILLDKPPNKTSHEVASNIKKMLNISKAGHVGTLDPLVSGVLPVGLNNATKALNILHLGPKEYHAIARIHAHFSQKKLESLLKQFCGKIYQKPPQRSSVMRKTRIRNVFELELVEQKENLVLLRICCESGTYIRKLVYDIGEILGSGATMIELRRNRIHQFNENNSHLVTLHELASSYERCKQKNDYTKLERLIIPIEMALSEIKSVIIRNSAVDALCHGAQLAIPGILKISTNLKKGDLVAIYTLKGEVVALAETVLNDHEIKKYSKGYAFKTKRIIMEPGTYEKNWNSSKSSN